MSISRQVRRAQERVAIRAALREKRGYEQKASALHSEPSTTIPLRDRLPLKWQEMCAIILALVGMFASSTIASGFLLAIAGALAFWGVLEHNYRKVGKVVGCVIVLIIGIGSFFYIKSDNDTKALALNEGILSVANEQDTSNCRAEADDEIAFHLGSFTIILHKIPPSIITLNNRNILALAREGDDLKITTLQLFDKNGERIATIDETTGPNSFWVSPNIRKIRKDKSSITVYNMQGEEALYIKFINSKSIYVRGIFLYQGRWVIATKDVTKIGGDNLSGSCARTTKDATIGRALFGVD